MTSRAEFEDLCESGEVHECHLDDLTLDTPILEAVFTDCHFSDIEFACDDIRDCKFIECSFERCTFSSLKIAECTFEQCRFYDSEQEKGCIFKFANLDGSRLSHSDLTMANFSRANLYRLEIDNCQVQGADFSHTTAVSSVSSKIVLRDLSISESNFAYSDFTGADLESGSICQCRLIHSDFSGANLTDSTLTDNELHGVTASGLTLVGADLRGSRLDGLDIREIDMSGVTIDSSQQQVLLETIGIIVADL